jgi:hypothetical protein
MPHAAAALQPLVPVPSRGTDPTRRQVRVDAIQALQEARGSDALIRSHRHQQATDAVPHRRAQPHYLLQRSCVPLLYCERPLRTAHGVRKPVLTVYVIVEHAAKDGSGLGRA